jgi:dTDP-4-dehydrorhamnose 3,5-epimerase
MKITPTDIPDVRLVEPQVFGDNRGFFFESYQSEKMAAGGIDATFVQDNHSGSERGTLRGLHYQLQHTQCKLVRAVAGTVFDVAVDIRRTSPTFGKWVGAMLSADNKHELWVPAGFAHGFYVVSEWAEVLYKATDYYAPDWERSIAWDDPELGIDWPLHEGKAPLLSGKDRDGASFAESEYFE